TVAAARVATELREDRDDVVGEVDRQVHVAALGGHLERHLPVAVDGGDLGAAVGQRDDAAGGGDADDRGVADLVLDVAAQVLLPRGQPAGDDDLRGVVQALQVDLRRVGREGEYLGGFGHGDGVARDGFLVVKVIGREVLR